MSKRVLWVVEMYADGEWAPLFNAVGGLAAEENREDGRNALKKEQLFYPSDRFRLAKYRAVKVD